MPGSFGPKSGRDNRRSIRWLEYTGDRPSPTPMCRQARTFGGESCPRPSPLGGRDGVDVGIGGRRCRSGKCAPTGRSGGTGVRGRGPDASGSFAPSTARTPSMANRSQSVAAAWSLGWK